MECLEQEKKKDSFVYVPPAPPIKEQTKKSARGPHHGGPFLGGDFCTETGAASNHRRIQEPS